MKFRENGGDFEEGKTVVLRVGPQGAGIMTKVENFDTRIKFVSVRDKCWSIV